MVGVSCLVPLPDRRLARHPEGVKVAGSSPASPTKIKHMANVLKLFAQLPESERAEVVASLQRKVLVWKRKEEIELIKKGAQPYMIVSLKELNEVGSWSPLDVSAKRLGLPRMTWEEKRKT